MTTERKDTEKKTVRKRYVRPQMEKVVLVPDDAVLTICKEPGVCHGNVQRPSAS